VVEVGAGQEEPRARAAAHAPRRIDGGQRLRSAAEGPGRLPRGTSRPRRRGPPSRPESAPSSGPIPSGLRSSWGRRNSTAGTRLQRPSQAGGPARLISSSLPPAWRIAPRPQSLGQPRRVPRLSHATRFDVAPISTCCAGVGRAFGVHAHCIKCWLHPVSTHHTGSATGFVSTPAARETERASWGCRRRRDAVECSST
jgi:hypothetical protein